MYVAVCGNLMQGYCHHELLGNSQLVGRWTFSGFEMRSTGDYPIVTLSPKPEHGVEFEVFQCSQKIGDEIAEFEGYGKTTIRRMYNLQPKKRTLAVALYHYDISDPADKVIVETYPRIPSGRWEDNKWLLTYNKLVEY